tara:strand:- start:244 stop:624 length:381 start_codon:yes stop_codon:yes gene_type:complete
LTYKVLTLKEDDALLSDTASMMGKRTATQVFDTGMRGPFAKAFLHELLRLDLSAYMENGAQRTPTSLAYWRNRIHDIILCDVTDQYEQDKQGEVEEYNRKHARAYLNKCSPERKLAFKQVLCEEDC